MSLNTFYIYYLRITCTEKLPDNFAALISDMSTYNQFHRTNRFHESLTGIFFILASATAITGLLLYDPILNHTDDLSYIKEHAHQVSLGALFELILCFSNIGTGIMLYPVLKQHHPSWSLGYVCFRLLEVVFILIGIISLLSLLSLIQENPNFAMTHTAGIPDLSSLLRTVHRWAFTLGPHFMLGINTMIYSIVFYQSRYIPRALSLYGIIAAILILLAAILEIFGVIGTFSTSLALMALPIALFEMVLAVWLITKGYRHIKHL